MQTGEEFQGHQVSGHSRVALYVLVAVLLGATVVSLAYLSRERQQTRELEATNQALTTSLTQLQTDLQSVNDRLNSLSASRVNAVAEAPSPRPKVPARVAAVRRAAVARPKDDSRFDRLEGKLSDQQKQLASTREDLDKTRQDLQGKLDSTRDDFSGSIARTHDELVALQKVGERNYYEFTLEKSKQFHRVGPLGVSLRKANVKRKSYDMTVLVDDNQLQKKSVNLFEPIWITLEDPPQSLELVVNKIDKDHIQGYVSEPKYKQSELNANPLASSGLAAGFMHSMR